MNLNPEHQKALDALRSQYPEGHTTNIIQRLKSMALSHGENELCEDEIDELLARIKNPPHLLLIDPETNIVLGFYICNSLKEVAEDPYSHADLFWFADAIYWTYFSIAVTLPHLEKIPIDPLKISVLDASEAQEEVQRSERLVNYDPTKVSLMDCYLSDDQEIRKEMLERLINSPEFLEESSLVSDEDLKDAANKREEHHQSL